MLRFRIALKAMTTTLLLCFLIGAIPAVFEAIKHGGQSVPGFDTYGGLAATARQLQNSLLGGLMLGSGSLLGAYVQNPAAKPRIFWYVLASLSSIFLAIIFAFGVEFALSGLDVLVTGAGQYVLAIVQLVISAAIGTWLVLWGYSRRVSAYA